jgi:hypothetical protein
MTTAVIIAAVLLAADIAVGLAFAIAIVYRWAVFGNTS